MTTIGIDLGTTNSCVAWHDGMKAEIIEVAGQTTFPSVVSVENGNVIVGELAKDNLSRRDRQPEFVFSNIKRHIGLPFNDAEDLGPQIAGDEDGMRAFIGPDRLFSPEELSAEILTVLKAAAEKRLGETITKAVICIPAYFDNNRQRATAEAARLAGFKTVTIFTEPEAAALAFGIEKQKYTRVAVFDLGGGTFDIVLMDVDQGQMEIVDKNGSAELGGRDWDTRIEDFAVARFQQKTGKDPRDRVISMLKLAPEAEKAKRRLSQIPETAVEVQGFYFDGDDKGMMLDISEPLTKAEFESLTADLVERCLARTQDCLDAAGRRVEQIDEVLLVGGMTRVPAIRAAVGEFFGGAKIRETVSADLAVAMGAATKGAQLDKRLRATFTNNITPQPFGIEAEGDVYALAVPKSAPYGEVYTLVVTTAEENQGHIPIAVLQGDRDRASENAVLARYDHPVAAAPAGEVRLTLEFMPDEDGVLVVSGRDESTGENFEILGAGS